MTGALKTRWFDWSTRFAALQKREKLLIAGAALAAIVMGGYSLWIEPALLQKTRLQKSMEQQQAEQAQLTTQLAMLVAKGRDPDATNRTALEEVRAQLEAAERDIKGFDRLLVPPAQAPALLQTLLARHRGLSLVSLATLAPQPLIAPPEKKAADGKPAAAPEADALAAGNNIYKHGIEIRVAGNYHDLLAYVSDLESGPQKLLWGGMSLAVKKHPVSELTLTVYTLSLESAWLVV
ncbi:MAG: type II secretion system protein GspM [Pseudomonadota bacterium]